MKLPDPPLLLVTDRRQARRQLPEVVGAAFAGGCRWVSLREKDLPEEEQIALARMLIPMARRHGLARPAAIPIWQDMSLRDLLKLLPIERLRNPPPIVTVVRLDGVIGPRQWATALSLTSHAGALDKAFAASGLSAVALAINSPGGSPVQSALLYRRIRQLADEKAVPRPLVGRMAAAPAQAIRQGPRQAGRDS